MSCGGGGGRHHHHHRRTRNKTDKYVNIIKRTSKQLPATI
jgi:hypothetical protein